MDSGLALWEAGPGRSRLTVVRGNEQEATAATSSAGPPLPEGVVTFLLTDIEKSSRLWEQDEAAMAAAIALHDELVGHAVASTRGVRPVEQGEGDSVVVAFERASDALACALELQRGLRGTEWPAPCELRVRMALHTGEAQLRDAGNYVGQAITRCARLRAIAHGGQTLLSRPTFELVADRLPDGADLKPLGLQRLKDLARAEEVFELAHPELPSGFPPLRSLDVLPNNLPVQLSSFVGRDGELAEIGRLLPDHRLITLIGAGGCGKTRLAIQVAADQVDRYSDGAWWADLAPLGDPELVVGALATALGIREAPGLPLLDTVAERMRDRRALVVLDNCEHVVAEAARVCEELLRRCPGVSLLATSREPLGADGEMAFRVPSLAVPDADTSLERGEVYSAVRLFVERARSGRPNFDLAPESWPAVVSICTQLDGMPLALELAAARTRLLSPHQIADGLGSRFALLSGGKRTALPRQQTLEHSVDWSYDLLDEQERTALRRASVFAGGFDLEAAEAVCAGNGIEGYAVLDLLSRLVDKSLVQVEEDGGPAVRYRLLETLRQYGGQKLADSGEGATVRDRHLEHYLALAEEAGPALEGHDQLTWLDRLDREHDNLRAAADWAAASGDGDRETRLAGTLWLFWVYRGHLSEGRARLDSALAGEGGELRARGAALVAQADVIACLAGDFGGARGAAEEAVAIGCDTSDPWLLARGLILLGWSELMTGDPGAANTLRKATEVGREAKHDFAISFALNALGYVELYTGQMGEAREHLREALATGRESGNRKAIFMALSWLAQLLIETGEYEATEEASLEGLAAARELGDPLLVISHQTIVGMLRLYTGEYEAARTSLEEAVAAARQQGLLNALSMALGYTCLFEALAGDGQSALEAGEEAVSLATALGLNRVTARWHAHRGQAAYVLGNRALARTCWDEAMAHAREWNDPWALGHALHGLALLAREDGEPAEAERLAHEALAVLSAAEYWPTVIDVLESLSALYVELEAVDRAARLVGAAEADRARRGQPRPPTLDARLAPDLERLRTDELETDRQAGAAMTLQEAISYASRGRGSRKRPAYGWSSLSPAELDVVRLVTEGLTNPQIGERLFISKRTVQTHLSHVFQKLGVSNRAEVAAEATRHSE
jgi:predicted ATPase/class 3 adenylate cyclase/DNA-binding CsgD family transcriptional regulator